MQPEEIKIEINQLKLSEQLVLVEDIWDSIAANNAEIPISEWQKQELDSRYKAYQSGNMELHDSQSVHDDLGEKYK